LFDVRWSKQMHQTLTVWKIKIKYFIHFVIIYKHRINVYIYNTTVILRINHNQLWCYPSYWKIVVTYDVINNNNLVFHYQLLILVYIIKLNAISVVQFEVFIWSCLIYGFTIIAILHHYSGVLVWAVVFIFLLSLLRRMKVPTNPLYFRIKVKITSPIFLSPFFTWRVAVHISHLRPRLRLYVHNNSCTCIIFEILLFKG